MDNLNENTENGYTNYLYCSSESQANRFEEIFSSLKDQNKEIRQYKTIVMPLYQGFVDEEHQIACYIDHQIFERYHKFNIKNGYSKKTNNHLKRIDYFVGGRLCDAYRPWHREIWRIAKD